MQMAMSELQSCMQQMCMWLLSACCWDPVDLPAIRVCLTQPLHHVVGFICLQGSALLYFRNSCMQPNFEYEALLARDGSLWCPFVSLEIAF